MEDDDKHCDRSSTRLGPDYCRVDSPISYSLSPARISSKASHSVRLTERERKSEDCRHSSHTSTKEMRSKDQKQKDHKAEVHRLAENICGDWSEHVSSSGKRYYYNCKTEVSQWEKPKDWHDSFTVPCGSRSSRSNSKLVSKEKLTDIRQPADSEAVAHHSNSDDSQNIHKSASSFESSATSVLFMSDSVDDKPASHTVMLASESIGLPNSTAEEVSNFDADADVRLASMKEERSPVRHTHQNAMCLNTNAVYGLDPSFETLPCSFHGNALGGHQVVDGEDMDISPGSTPTEESLLEKKINASCFHNELHPHAPVMRRMTPNSTFLSTLSALQHALHQVTLEKSTASGNSASKSVPPSVLNLLAALPSLICQLRSADSSTVAASSAVNQQAHQQQLTQNVIHMLQKLQQVLVAQQQQQQQRQLQELLLQLLTVQRQGTVGGQSSPDASPQQYQGNAIPTDESKMESPYSPPDSDGTPLGSPENKPAAESALTLLLNDVAKEIETSGFDDHGFSASKPATLSPNRPSTLSPVVMSTTGSSLALIPGSIQSTILVGTSQLAAAAVNRKLYDSAGLTPTLTNYVNSQLVDHVTGWHTDIADKQANCYSEESHSLSSLHCTQVSVDLKRARSLVRINEIQSTLQEQRVMLIRQQTKDLESMRSGLSFYAAVPSGTF